jgi:histidine triad (HIT) family protein
MPCFKIYEDDRTLVFPDINPVTDGHTLVISRAHYENLYEIAAEDLAAVHHTTQKVIHGLKKALDPVGVAVLQLNGRGVNQVIMHYHVHLIPRGTEDPPLAVSDCGAKPGDMDELKQTAERIATAIEA